jgi:hypothetical protein
VSTSALGSLSWAGTIQLRSAPAEEFITPPSSSDAPLFIFPFLAFPLSRFPDFRFGVRASVSISQAKIVFTELDDRTQAARPASLSWAGTIQLRSALAKEFSILQSLFPWNISRQHCSPNGGSIQRRPPVLPLLGERVGVRASFFQLNRYGGGEGRSEAERFNLPS